MTTDEKLIELILEDQNASRLLTVEARKNLYLKYISSRSRTYLTKSAEIADLYQLGKRFGVHHTTKLLREFLNVSQVTLDGRLHMARSRGEINKVYG